MPSLIKVDACPSGPGGICNGQAYFVDFRQWFQERDYSINYLECTNILFAIRYFWENLQNKNLVTFLDNTAAVATVTNFKACDGMLRAVAREVVMQTAAADAKIKVSHTPETLTCDADALSRHSLGAPFTERIKMLERKGMKVKPLPQKF